MMMMMMIRGCASKMAISQNGHNQSGHKRKRPQTKTATKRYQNGQIHLANERSFGHQFLIITAEISTSWICQQVHCHVRVAL